MGFLDHIRACNTGDPAAYRPFAVDGVRVGWIAPSLADALPDVDPGFIVTPDRVTLAPELRDFESRSSALDRAARHLVDTGVVRGLRGEHYPVMARWGAEPMMRIDRAAVTPFGVAAYGLHVNGFVRDGTGGLSVWVARRASDRAVSPGKFDNLIGGGQPIGLTLAENLAKEAQEEAGIDDPAIIARAVPVGAITYLMGTGLGLKPDTLFIYDLELDPGFTPVNTDGEVEAFELWPVERVMDSVRDTDAWKFNVNLVVIDFLIRHGHLTPDHPDYLDLVSGLRRPL
nr:DUF4743 domain-containing protein [Azospirillum halopraeferens]